MILFFHIISVYSKICIYLFYDKNISLYMNVMLCNFIHQLIRSFYSECHIKL
uniref:Uncharacterized protein n=1 Tax=Prolemur simus TaxID=1328070 RepID=A0A8C8YEH4_PROSS